MTEPLPDILVVKGDKLVPVSWEGYACILSRVLNLNLKWVIVRNLVELVQLYRDPSNCQTFSNLWAGVKESDIVVRQQMFSMQAIAATVDLTENFAAMCFTYAESLQNGVKYLPLLLRDFGSKDKMKERYSDSKINYRLGNATQLFDAMLDSEKQLTNYLACSDEPTSTIANKRKTVSEIRKFRRKYQTWYNRFKHTNSVFAFAAIFDVPGVLSAVHKIPDHLSQKHDMVTFKDEKIFASIVTDEGLSHVQTDSFLTAYQNLNDVYLMLALLERFWQPVRRIQHKRLFGEELPSE